MPGLPAKNIAKRVHRTYRRRKLEAAMKVIYDSEVDVLSIHFSQEPIKKSDEGKAGFIIDYDKDGNIVGLEIMEASMRVENPRAMEYAVMT
jgi:uncharacterized protein YuzE